MDTPTWITRYWQSSLLDRAERGKILTLYGPRRVGKTSLVEKVLASGQGRTYYGTGDDLPLQTLFDSQSVSLICTAFSGYDRIFIDEAQRIPKIGIGLKILVDTLKDVTIIASGSSSFTLASELGEPLTGRSVPLTLYPLSQVELAAHFGTMYLLENLEQHLIYGLYPEVLTDPGPDQKRDYLMRLCNSYLFKDILELHNLRNPSKLHDLLRLIAFQIGKEVSLNELASTLGIAKQSVERYLDLLEKSFVVIKVRGFSRNLRKEVTKSSRYYFVDNGIRNALINNFNPSSMRDDMGMLWENFLFMERLKKQVHHTTWVNRYFWRTYDHKELDYVEEADGALAGFEFKWGNRKSKLPALWQESYPTATVSCINRENFLEFVL